MRSARALHLGLMIWLTACMAVVVPAHHHHDHPAADHASSQPAAKPGHKCHHDGCELNDPFPRQESPAERHDHTDDCSICHFASGIVHPHPVDVTMVRPEPLEVATASEPATVISRQVIVPFHGRAPPAAA